LLNDFSTLEKKTMFSTLENPHGSDLFSVTIHGSTIANHGRWK
tara:strand:- start:428 stop:556 length:129 start_codon:yes stop_codon:yes gene_type:complete